MATSGNTISKTENGLLEEISFLREDVRELKENAKQTDQILSMLTKTVSELTRRVKASGSGSEELDREEETLTNDHHVEAKASKERSLSE